MTAIATPLPEDIQAVRDGVVDFARAEVLPRHAAHREMFENPRKLFRKDGRICDEVLALVGEVRMASAKAGFYSMSVPEGLGGAGFGMLAYYVCWEELFRTCGPANWLMLYAISHWAFGPSQVLERVTPRAQNEILGPMMAGEQSMCFGLSEPGAGSDASKLNTEAIGDGWRISGRKIWTSNAPVAGFCIVFARTESSEGSGISAFLVPSSSPGFHIERIIKMFGSIGGEEAELRFEDVKVEPWQLVGGLHQGFATAIYGVSIGRIYNSARAVGYGRWALEKAL